MIQDEEYDSLRTIVAFLFLVYPFGWRLLRLVGQEWEQQIIVRLLPFSHRENEDFFNQSVSLYTPYYHL